MIISYLKFLWKSTNEHGVHSPFVYGLVSKCFYDRKKYSGYPLLWKYKRSIKKSGPALRKLQLLNRVVRYLKVRKALVLGSLSGAEAAALAAGNKMDLIAVPAGNRNLSQEMFQKSKIENVELHAESPLDGKKLPTEINKSRTSSAIKDPKSYDLLYFGQPCLLELPPEHVDYLLQTAHNDAVFIFEKIHQTRSSEAAWKKIKANASVRVTIDTYFWGFAFFRREQAKEHFIVRC